LHLHGRIEIASAALVGSLIVIGSGCTGGLSRPQATVFSDEHVRVRLVSETMAWAPGDTAWVGVHFAMSPGWHVYGEGRSDSGLPIAVETDAPEGFTILPLIWPAAERHVAEGGVVDQIYEESVTLLLPVLVPDNARTGEPSSIRSRVDWLVCGTGCIPGNAELSLTVPIRRGSKDPDPSAEPLFAASRTRVPRPLPGPEAGVTQTISASAFRWAVRFEGAAALIFLPAADCSHLVDPLADPVSLSDRLEIRFTRDGEEPPVVRGVLEVAESGASAWYRVDTPLESASN
jgi:thiol:disulfide interchange protein DsbD